MKPLIAALCLFTSFQTFANGGDKPGPHGGEVKMPGAFHTELIFEKETQEAMVFLLDMEFKNPTLNDSSVTAYYKKGKTKVEYSCMPMHDHFHCMPEKKFTAKGGELYITAVRAKAQGNEVVYKMK